MLEDNLSCNDILRIMKAFTSVYYLQDWRWLTEYDTESFYNFFEILTDKKIEFYWVKDDIREDGKEFQDIIHIVNYNYYIALDGIYSSWHDTSYENDPYEVKQQISETQTFEKV